MNSRVTRRDFLKKSAAVGVGASLYPLRRIWGGSARRRTKLLILGIDGMDPHLVGLYMQRGLMPNFRRLADIGSMCSVATSFPPQSPVAWSTFSVGASSAVHGIYDFIHRDPKTRLPFLSTARVRSGSEKLKIGSWIIPLSSGDVQNLRKGRPFWEYLADEDIPASIFKMPANFPCRSDNCDMVSGMGTPDLHGGYGSFTLFTDSNGIDEAGGSGGKIVSIGFKRNSAQTFLAGPKNLLRESQPEIKIPIRIWRDSQNPVVRLLIQGKQFILKQGEWSAWILLSFQTIPYVSDIKGICKIYLKKVHPDFMMYVSPINIDPSDPVLPVVSTEKYGRELVDQVGYFYTQGLPEDTKALSCGVLDDNEFLELTRQIIVERNALLDYELDRFSRQKNGLLFFYFSSLDQGTHMYWRAIDREHPLHTDQLFKDHGHTIQSLYAEIDRSLGKVLDKYDLMDPNHTLMVMSDHGFAPFRKQVNVNTWLVSKGYMHLAAGSDTDNSEFFSNVNWQRTAAYALGINGLYLNLAGRENLGIIPEAQRTDLINRIKNDLLSLYDPETGHRVVSRIKLISAAQSHLQPYAPDLIIGWNQGYRTSWESILGGFSKEILRYNQDKWSGDHCIDPALVSSVFFCNRHVTKKKPILQDITASIFAEFNIPLPSSMEGSSLFEV